MTKNEPATGPDPAPGEPAVSWREAAVSRSLGSARARAENRVQRFLDAAIELMNEGDAGKDFTVQEVVERSGQSLRTFYQYFGGKQELLLAVFEESVRSTTAMLSERIAEEDDAFDRLHRFVVEYYRICRPAPQGKSGKKSAITSVMVDFAQQLLTGHPKDAAMAFAPLVSLFGDLLDDAAAAGAIRAGLRSSPIAGVVLEAIMFNAFSATIGGKPAPDSEAEPVDPAEELWDLIVNGIGSGRTA
jgi:AcrR family transcriptional regulator